MMRNSEWETMRGLSLLFDIKLIGFGRNNYMQGNAILVASSCERHMLRFFGLRDESEE
jgi:hypothetical protein